jgi:AcrR family transcriptional regulator
MAMIEESTPARRRPGPRKGDFEPRRQARFFEIVDLAAGLFAERGYAGTNVGEIGDAAGLGRGALYHYIGSKANLLTEIQKRFMDPLLHHVRLILEAEDLTWPVKLRLASQSHLTIQRAMLAHSRVISREAQHLPAPQLEQFMASQRAYEQAWSSILEGGRGAGDFSFENLSITRLGILSMHNYTMNWIRPTGSLSAEDISRYYCHIVLGGIASGVDLARLEDEVRAAIPRLSLDL